MTGVIPFRSKAKSYPTPHDMLRDLAELDATVLFRIEPDATWFIGYEAPRAAHAKFQAIMHALDRCGETWRHEYVFAVHQLLDIDVIKTELPPGFNRRLKLRTAYVIPIPTTGAKAFRLLYELNAEARELAEQGLQHQPQWLSASSRCDDLFRTLLAARGTTFGMEAAAEAHRLATELGIELGGVR